MQLSEVARRYNSNAMQLEQEKALVERARTDSSAFGELHEAYYSRIFGYALRRTADFQTA